MSRIIHYIGPYCDLTQSYRNLLFQPSAVTKMDYIFSSLRRNGFHVTLYSPTPTKNNFFCHFSQSTYHLDENTKITYADTFGGPTVLFKVLTRLWSFIQLFIYLFQVRPEENVLLYHLYQYRFVVKTVLLIRKIKLFIEIEEVYEVLLRQSLRRQKTEMHYLNCASGYILVNDVIGDRCKLDSKPYAICYGDYSIKPNRVKANDGLIHLVYTGLIENGKSAVNYSLDVIQVLPANYKLHITGYGQQKSIDDLTILIKKINNKLNREAIEYHGCLDYKSNVDFISSFHIGLATSDFSYYESSFMFPSKILVYLSVNLAVVASPLTCIESSKLNSTIIIPKDNSPASLADSVLSIDISKIDNTDILNNLDEQFVKDLKELFEGNSSKKSINS